MKDILLELERDPEMQEILEDLTDTEKDHLLSEMTEIIKNFNSSLAKMKAGLETEDSVIDFFDNLEKAISMSDIDENIGVEVIEWPEKP
jgi:hypothetical protein